MREEGKEGNKRRPRMRLEFSGGGILVLGGVIIAAAWAAHRRHVNRERNKRRTTQGPGDEAGYEQYHKEKEEEVKDSSEDKGFGEISAAVDDGLLKIKKVGSIPLIEEQTAGCSFDDDGTELCVCQSHTEKTEEAERSVEKIEMVVDHVEQVEGKDGDQEVGEEKVNSCSKEDGCDEVGEGDALNQVPIHVEDDTKQVVKEEEERDLSFIDVLPKDESFVTVLMANTELLEDVHHQREEEEEEVYHKESCEEELEKGEEERELLINIGVLKDEGESCCREEECNSEEEEEPETESYEEEIEPLVEEETEKGGEELQVNEAHEHKEESFSNDVPKDEELDAHIEQVEEETELTANTEELDTELTANTEELEARVIESNEEETVSSDDSGVIETDETDETDATEELDAVWPAEVIETDETENKMKINDNSGQATMKKLVITMDKEKGKEFFYMMSHSRSMFLLVLAMALALGFLSFHLSQFTVT